MPISVQPSNYSSIQKAINQIVMTQTSFILNGSKIGDVPTPEQLSDPSMGYPYFAIRQGKLKGFATGTQLNQGEDFGQRGIDVTEPVWDFDCYVLFQYTPEIPNYDLAATALVTLATILMDNPTLPLSGVDTCPTSNPHTWDLGYYKMGDTELTVATFTVRAYEILQVSNS